MIRVEFDNAIWYEEELRIDVHPKDPFRRVDLLPSHRPIKIRIRGQQIAESDFAWHVHETGKPCRYYVHRSKVESRKLLASPTVTHCPYKGKAVWFDVEIFDDKREERITVLDLAWQFTERTWESERLRHFICFKHENEHVEVEVDGKIMFGR